MNHLLLQPLNKDVSSPLAKHQTMMPIQQQGRSNVGPNSNMAFLIADPVVRDARIRLDSKKLFFDDLMFYPENKPVWSVIVNNNSTSGYAPAVMHSYGLTTYNQRVSQHTNLSVGMGLSDTNSNAMTGPAPLHNLHSRTGQTYGNIEQYKQTRTDVNPYLVSGNAHQSYVVNDNTNPQNYYTRGSKGQGNNNNNNVFNAGNTNKW